MGELQVLIHTIWQLCILSSTQVKCDECETWFHQRCINLQMSTHYVTKCYETTKFVGACCSKEFKLQI